MSLHSTVINNNKTTHQKGYYYRPRKKFKIRINDITEMEYYFLGVRSERGMMEWRNCNFGHSMTSLYLVIYAKRTHFLRIWPIEAESWAWASLLFNPFLGAIKTSKVLKGNWFQQKNLIQFFFTQVWQCWEGLWIWSSGNLQCWK
jgi:hypothetical protein